MECLPVEEWNVFVSIMNLLICFNTKNEQIIYIYYTYTDRRLYEKSETVYKIVTKFAKARRVKLFSMRTC